MNKLKLFLNKKIVVGVVSFVMLTLLLSGFFAIVGAWTNPSQNPPNGSGVLTTSGSNIGVGTTTPGAKLGVAGSLIVDGPNAVFPAGSISTSEIADGAIENVKLDDSIQRYNYLLNPSFDWFNVPTGSGTHTDPADAIEVFYKWYSRKSGATPPSFTITTETSTSLKKSGNSNYGQSIKVDITAAGATSPRQYIDQFLYNIYEPNSVPQYINGFAWVYTTTANKIKLALTTQANTWYSGYHGGTGWEKLTVQAAAGSSGARDVWFKVGVIDTDAAILTYYVDDAGLYVGDNLATSNVSYYTLRKDIEDLMLMMGSNETTPGKSFAPRYAIVRKTATYTAVLDDNIILVDATAGVVTVNLPYFGNKTGKTYTIKKLDSSANAVTVDGYSTETIDGATTYSLASQNKYVTIVANDQGGTNWVVVANN